jgi:hypothetical protein
MPREQLFQHFLSPPATDSINIWSGCVQILVPCMIASRCALISLRLDHIVREATPVGKSARGLDPFFAANRLHGK